MKLEGASVVVTGGASGLGLAAAQRFLSCGAKVATIDIAQGDDGFLHHSADVADEEQMEAALAQIAEEHGPPSILVNAAGKAAPFKRTYGKSGAYDLTVFRDILNVNLVGSFNCARLAARHMADRPPGERGERGVILHVASINAFDAPLGTVAYSAAKAGVVGMTLAMARDLAGYGIRVCTIAPGSFDTPILDRAFNGDASELLADIPFPNDRLGDADDFALLATQICENPMLNGETIRLDGAARLS